MKSTWLTAHGSGVGRLRLQGNKKCLYKGQELNDLVANAVKEVLKANKHEKYKAANDSGLEEEPDKFNVENFIIGEELNNASGKRKNESK